MDEQQARRILGPRVQSDGTLRPTFQYGHVVVGLNVTWPGYGSDGRLNRGVVAISGTNVTPDQLEAIAWWVRHETEKSL